MKIISDILNSIKTDSTVKEVLRGLHWTAVVSKHCGLASAMPQETCDHREEENESSGLLTDMTALKLAQFIYSSDTSKASLGLAAINSQLELNSEKCSDINGIDLLCEKGRDKNISVIGHFPNLDKLGSAAKNFWIIEKHPLPGDFPEDSIREFLPQSDIVIISSTTLINHTISNILNLCKENSIKMLLGPSTPLSEVLFDHGIDILSGSIVTDKDTALKYISEGANFIRLKKTGSVRFVTVIKDREKLENYS
jgi:uncharacterized protein